MSKRGKASVPKSGSGKRPSPSTKRQAKKPQSGNGQPRTATKDTTLLLRKKEVREDTQLLQTAVQQRWPIPRAKVPVIVRRLIGIVRKRSVTVVTKTGDIVDAEAPADTNSILAARVLAQMEAQNQKDDFKGEPESKHEHQHLHIHNTANGDGAESPIDPEAEQRRTGLLELAAAWRARGLVIDGVRVEQSAEGGMDRTVSHSPSKPAGTGN